jgi:HAD superfamily hydrolase (TIGR01549 family)
MEVHGVFFDLYGTLLLYDNLEQGWYDWRKAFVDTLKKSGINHPDINIDSVLEDFYGITPEADANSGYSPYELRLERFGKRFGYTFSKELIEELTEATVGSWHHYISLDPEVPAVLAEIKRTKKVALISNFNHYPYIYRVLNKFNITGLFDHITISGEIGVEKPDPAVFTPALNATGLDPAQVLYVGDSGEDIEGAQNAGIIPVLIDRYGTGPKVNARRIKKLSELSA